MFGVVAPQAETGCRPCAASVVKVVAGARMPRLPSMEGDVKHDTTVGEWRLGVKVNKLKHHTSVKVTIDVGSVKLAARVAPAALCVAATDELVTSNLENVCEIRPQRDLELNVHR